MKKMVKKADLASQICIMVKNIVQFYQTDALFDFDFFLNISSIGEKWYWVLRECGTNLYGDQEQAEEKIATYWKNCYRLIRVERVRGGWTFEVIAENCVN